MNNRQALQKVAFLDTNILHYIGIYLEYAKDREIFPWGPEESMTAQKNAAVENVDGITEAGLKKSLKQGLETVAFFVTPDMDVQVQYSSISELELLNGRAKGKAILSAAEEGVPDRMWSRFREEEISAQVGVADLKEVKDRVDGLASMLEESGVFVKTSGGDETRDVLELAKGINGLIYMEAMDSIIYASALIARADYLFTADRYLKETVNRIWRPDGRAPYEEIRRELRRLVESIALGAADEVELPSAHMITADGKPDPSIPVPGHDRSS